MITVKWQQRRSDLLNTNLYQVYTLQEHFGFKLLADHNIKNADQVYCILSDKLLAYHESNRSRTCHFKKKHLLQYSKFQLATSASVS